MFLFKEHYNQGEFDWTRKFANTTISFTKDNGNKQYLLSKN